MIYSYYIYGVDASDNLLGSLLRQCIRKSNSKYCAKDAANIFLCQKYRHRGLVPFFPYPSLVLC